MRLLTVLAALALIVACAPQQAVAPSQGAAATATSVSTPALSPTAVPSTASPPAPLGAAPSAVRFSDLFHGWVGVDDGIFGTDDAGTVWRRQLTSARIVKIWSYDARRAWALAADDTVYRTRDGAQWAAIPHTTPPIAEIDPFSPDLLWAIAVASPPGGDPARRTGTVLISSDGGVIWRPIGTRTMWSVCFGTIADGVGAEGKQIFRTSDAGRTWTPIATLPITDTGPWFPTLSCPIGTNFRVQIAEPFAALSHAPYLVYRTNDDGRSWTLEFREGYTLGSTTPVDTPGLGSYPSTFGSLLAGGRAWFITCSPPTDTQEFLLLGPRGDTLARGPVPIPGCAADGQVLDERHVIAISRIAAALLATDDGGATWRPIYRGTPRR